MSARTNGKFVYMASCDVTQHAPQPRESNTGAPGHAGEVPSARDAADTTNDTPAANGAADTRGASTTLNKRQRKLAKRDTRDAAVHTSSTASSASTALHAAPAVPASVESVDAV